MGRGRPRNYDEAAVLEAAIQVFWDRGFDEAALSEVMERSGISRQSLYTTYGSKRDLFLAAITKYADDSEAEWERLLGAEESPLESLRTFFSRWSRCPKDLKGRGCLMVASINAVGERDEPFAKFAAEHLERQRARLEAAIGRAKDAGELRKDVDPAALASQLLAQILGMATYAQLGPATSHVGAAAAGALDLLERYAN